MDQVTQSNAAQTEELTSTAQSLAAQAEELQALVGRFKLGRRRPMATRPADGSVGPQRRGRWRAGGGRWMPGGGRCGRRTRC